MRAILAYEMGHLFYRDSVRSIALIFSSCATRVVMCFYSLYVVIAYVFTKNAKGEIGGAAALASWIPIIIFLPVLCINWIGILTLNRNVTNL